MNRTFIHARRRRAPLSQNVEHNFALAYTLRGFASSVCCTWIPKNACSSLRYSFGVANGCLSDISDIHWIHANNQTFNATTETAFLSKYAFVILRCPLGRLYSAFMDKYVSMDIQAWHFRNSQGRKFHPQDLSFEQFVKDLGKTPRVAFDPHVRPQTHFLLYEQYDDYFRLEQIGHAVEQIRRKAGIEIYDTREALGHDTTKLEKSSDFVRPFDTPAIDLMLEKRSGRVPKPAAMFDGPTVETAFHIYEEDLNLYYQHFGASELMDALGWQPRK